MCQKELRTHHIFSWLDCHNYYRLRNWLCFFLLQLIKGGEKIKGQFKNAVQVPSAIQSKGLEVPIRLDFFPLGPCQSFHISSQKMWRWNVLSERINCWKTFLFRNSHCSRKNCVSYVEYFLGKSAWGGRGSLGLVWPRRSQDFGGWLGNTCVFPPPAHRPRESSFGWASCWRRECSACQENVSPPPGHWAVILW